jgi:cobalt-zinc-cadmium efflux system membrane fusion protein
MKSKKFIVAIAICTLIIASFLVGTSYQGRSQSRKAGVFASTQSSPQSQQGLESLINNADSDSQSSDLDWCIEHRVPESECTRCNPELIEKFKSKDDWCEEHGLPESHDRLCNPGIIFSQEPPTLDSRVEEKDYSIFFPPNQRDCATNDAVIQFTSTETAKRCGLTFASTMEAPTSKHIEAPAEVVFDGVKTSAVTTTVPVAVVRWLIEPGQSVSKGQKLAEASSPEIAGLQADLVEASAEWTARQQELSRKEQLYKDDIIKTADYQAALTEAKVAEARYTKTRGLLSAAGFSDQDLKEIEETMAISANFSLRAPANGVLVERSAKPGQLLSPGESIALISDVSSLWAEAKVGEKDIRNVKIGQKAEFSLDGRSIDRVPGKVIWVAQYLDEITRSGIVRVELASSEDGVRAHEFGRLFIFPEDSSPKVLVPKDAVQWEGCCNVVFVQETPDRLRPRKVKIGRGDMESYLVYDGLRAGEKVVVSGSYLLKTELMKESIGAGCCEVESGA